MERGTGGQGKSKGRKGRERGKEGRNRIDRTIPDLYGLDMIPADIRDHLQSSEDAVRVTDPNQATKRKGVGWIHLYYVHILTRHRIAKNYILIGCKRESEIRRARKEDITTKLFCRE